MIPAVKIRKANWLTLRQRAQEMGIFVIGVNARNIAQG
jgi:hypothetical protein